MKLQLTLGEKTGADLEICEGDEAEDGDEDQEVVLRVELHIRMAGFVVAVVNCENVSWSNTIEK